jgi:hypothetical protein
MADLAWWLENFKQSAFRLEALPAYSMPEEAEMLTAFRRGERVRLPEDHPWPPLVRTHCSTGKVMQRVRVVSHPLTDYERFELSLYPHSVDAGEDIRITDDPSLRYADFWLFDSQTVIVIRYDAEGRFTGIHQPSDVVTYRAIRDRVLEYSIPLAEFTARAART